MRDLVETVRNSLKEQHMAKPGDTVVCAVSGGADSVCLVHVLYEIGRRERKPFPLTLYCVHVHHGIRGAEADEDAAFVRALAATLNIPFILKSVDAPGGAKKTPHMSLEEAARNLRYQALMEAARTCGAPDGSEVKIAVAHNEDDNAETVLFNLFRGTGMRGLKGISPASGALIRPLFNISRAEIEAYLEKKGLTYRTDHTNNDVLYARNRIRREMLKSAKEHINAQASHHIAQTAADMLEAGRFLDGCVDAAYARCRVKLPPYLAGTEGVRVALAVSALRKEDAFLRAELISRLLHTASAQAVRQNARPEAEAVPCEMSDPALPSSYYQIARSHIRAVNGLVLSSNGRADLDLPGRLLVSRRNDYLMILVKE